MAGRTSTKSQTSTASNHTLVQKVVDYVVANIASGRYAPATKLRQKQLAEELQISPIPVREAMEKLHLHGWVERIPQRGAFVREFDEKDLEHMCQLREAFETTAARIVSRTITEQQLAELKGLIGKMEQALQRPDPEAFSAADAEFHRRLVRYTENTRMIELFEAVFMQLHSFLIEAVIDRMFQVGYAFDRGPRESLHIALYEALAARSPDLAERCVRAHVQRALQTAMHLRKVMRLNEERPARKAPRRDRQAPAV